MFCERPVALSVLHGISSLGQLTRTLNYPAAASAASFLLNLQLGTCFLFFSEHVGALSVALHIPGHCRPAYSPQGSGCDPVLHHIYCTPMGSRIAAKSAMMMLDLEALISRALSMSHILQLVRSSHWPLFVVINMERPFY